MVRGSTGGRVGLKSYSGNFSVSHRREEIVSLLAALFSGAIQLGSIFVVVVVVRRVSVLDIWCV